MAPEEEALRWTDEEMDALKKALKEHGTSWSKVAEKVGTKTHHQCKSFYFNCRKKLGLDLLVQEYNKVRIAAEVPDLQAPLLYTHHMLIFFNNFF